jgi:hypothetical protein
VAGIVVTQAATVAGEKIQLVASWVGAQLTAAYNWVASITAETVVDTISVVVALSGIFFFFLAAGLAGGLIGAIVGGKVLFTASLAPLAKIAAVSLWSALACDIAASVLLNFRDSIVSGIKSAYSALGQAADVAVEAASSAANTAVRTGRRLLTVDAVAVEAVPAG